MVAAVKTEGLTRHFGKLRAVEDLTLEVHEGDVYGFLGLNGAGKTTTLRMLLRLIRPSSGRALVFGRDVARDFIRVMRGVGSLVELPAAYPYLSAWKNLEILRLATGGIPHARLEEVLELVGLHKRMHDRVGTYSQGMRQRLGIAMALLPRPKLVVLDEPLNGLDPKGMTHIRHVIQTMNRDEGVTFLVSSHLLHEVEMTCNRVGILKEGRLVLEDTVERILERTVSGLRVRCDRPAEALEKLKALPWVREASEEETGTLLVQCDPARFPEVNALLHEGGHGVGELTPVRRTLEEFFLSQ